MTWGTLYGVGVGPGDPKLLTLRAVEVLGQADRIFAAASTKNDHSIALDIVTPHLKDGADVERLGFPMTRDKGVLAEAWRSNAARIADYLRSGKSGAFITLGDPMLYSTFAYVARELERDFPDIPIEVVPGITSMQAAAARTRTMLAAGGESLAVLSGVADEETLRSTLHCAENLVILKAYKGFGMIRRVLQEEGMAERARFASLVGHDGETVHARLDEAPDRPHYLSLVMVPAPSDRTLQTERPDDEMQQ
ncbi:precorrin-2 C(20)-methyltransferase [Oceanidesulfovibrio indonesiensis]|uniref:Precorrin-2 C(20)-methyltransferase n=1 Tax=Oceanidesulfovibrio indonesiensis TaxID=54767 RepID=A0A7M3MDU5_9BACT|nr:precorrin-2 C(20)-methyltransferase [Oceanidesulfovibrio indonesiensis]TVM16875.1 precorrin-2 C(20)-methyltransferase [Oceanidesulfovibrio indonesiensis]